MPIRSSLTSVKYIYYQSSLIVAHIFTHIPIPHSSFLNSLQHTCVMAPAVFPPFTLSGLAGENERTDETLKIWSDALANVPVVEILPPNVEKDTWMKVLDEFRSIVGPDSVFTGELHKLHYGDPFALFDNDTDIRGSAAALRPTTVEQIQAILKLANQHKIPLWTIGRGKNLGYGGPAARVKGSVVIDLQNMDKVLEVNDKYAYYTVEPGVSFFKLFETIKAQKKNVWCSVPALGWGSVVGNALDRVSFTIEY
jgi:4-cresol dehydrogenase (hydroxylating)